MSSGSKRQHILKNIESEIKNVSALKRIKKEGDQQFSVKKESDEVN